MSTYEERAFNAENECERLKAEIEQLRMIANNHAWQENEQCNRAARAEAERDAYKRTQEAMDANFEALEAERDALRALATRAKVFMESLPTDSQLDARMINGDTGRALWGDLDAALAKGGRNERHCDDNSRSIARG